MTRNRDLAVRALREGNVHKDAWYKIRNEAGTPEVLIYGEIGFPGIDPEAFVKDLARIEATALIVRIHSVGGDAFDGMAIYNALRSHPARITTVIDGIAASAASFIAQAGDERLMHRAAEIMVHDAYGLMLGDADDFDHYAEALNRTSDRIAEIYAERAGGTVDGWRAIMRSETWFGPQEALEFGLVDRVIEDDDQPADSVPRRDDAQLAAQLAEARAQVAEYLADDPVDLRARIDGFLETVG